MYDERLVTDNINLIYLALKRLYLYDKRDEYFDVGMIGLVKGARAFDETRGLKPSTFLYNCIYNELRMTFRKKDPDGMLSLSKVLFTDGNGNELFLEDMIPSDVNIEEEMILKEQKEKMYNEILKLKEREKLVICLSYGVGGYEKITEKEISKILKISQAQVNRIKNKTIEKLRNNLK